ncbi:MAG TPA: mechanosensitive ion channel [Flavipsychrobacter sp.]|jgi:small conductance mechanosensitive channel|nr:mechanosensitive ion channel [Flavipsychrobacter sp.]
MLLLQVDQMLSKSNVWMDKIKEVAFDYSPRIIGAILVYLVGNFVINKSASLIRTLLIKRNFDSSLQTFLLSIYKVTLLILMFLAIAGMIGIDITGFAALLAGVGIAIGAALNGSLGNLAGGVMLMIYKPFKVGDIIEAQGCMGVVQEIGIFGTTILSPENKTIIIPNGGLSTGVITNFNTHGNLRVDLMMAIAASQDIDKAREVAIEAIKQHPTVLSSPAPEVNVLKVGDGMVQLAIRPYTTQSNYWDVYFGVQERVKKAWDAASVQAPIPTHIAINK